MNYWLIYQALFCILSYFIKSTFIIRMHITKQYKKNQEKGLCRFILSYSESFWKLKSTHGGEDIQYLHEHRKRKIVLASSKFLLCIFPIA